MPPPEVPAEGWSRVSVRNRIATHVREGAGLPQWEMFPPTPLSSSAMIWRECFFRQRKRPWLAVTHYLAQVHGSPPTAMWQLIAPTHTESSGRISDAPDLLMSSLLPLHLLY